MDRPTCARCTNLWQWGGLCPECVNADDHAASVAMKQPRSSVFTRSRAARGLHDHQRAAKAPRRQPGVN